MALFDKIKGSDLRRTTQIRVAGLLVFFLFSIGTLSAQNATTTCSGVTFSYNNEPGYTLGETYSWTIVSAPGSISGQTIGLGGANAVTQTLTNSGNTPATITYNVITSKPSTFTLDVTVNPTASLSNTGSFISPICSGVAQNYSALSNIAGTSINWTRAPKAGISNLGGAGTTNVTETLINTTTAPVTVPYVFTLTTAAGCVSSQTINADVNPTPVLTSSTTPPAICSGTAFSYTPTSSTSGATFDWTRATQASISNGAGFGTGNPSETLISTSITTVNVAYVYTITANGCSNAQTVTVPVNPTPVVSSTQTATACNNGAFTISPTGVPTGTQYTWANPAISPAGSITGGSAQVIPQNNINQTLSNNTLNPATATYTITPTAGGCTGPTFSGVVTVTPALSPVTNLVNQSITACNNAPFSVSPAGVPSGTQYTWSAPTYSPAGSLTGGVAQGTPQNSIYGTLVNNTTAPGTANYTVTPIIGSCTGTNFTVSVTVNNPAVLSSSLTPPAICSNSLFSYNPTSATANTSFTWTRSVVAGISNTAATGTGNPNETLINISAVPVTVNYVYLLTTGSCVNAQTVSVVVNPAPTLSSATPNPICSGTKFSYNPLSATAATLFDWSRPVVPFISNNAATGTGNPNEVLINTSINPVVVPYYYTLTANGCTNTQTVNVLVNPVPVVPNQIASTCNNTPFVVSPVNVPTGTQYTWAAPTYNPVLSISGGSAQGTLQNNISQTLTNQTINPAVATYVVTPNANGCVGSTFSLAVTVSAATYLTSSLTPPAICSNTAFNYNPTSNTFGTAFGWTRPNITGIAEVASSGAGNPNEVLVNTTTGVVSVPYLFTLTTPSGCVSTQTVTVNVNPAPVLSSNLIAPAICTGALFSYTPTAASAGASFSWSRPVVPSISNAAASGSGLNYPSEILVNTGTLPVTVPYYFTTTVNACSNTQTVTVVVNPKPSVPNQSTTICGNTAFSVLPTGVIAGTQYTWTLPTTAPIGSITGTSAQSILQDSISQLLGNVTINNAIATYTVTPIANGCQGSNFTIDVTVKPTPGIANQILQPVCSGVAFNYAAVAIPAGTTYTWSNPIIGPANSLIGGSAQAINQNSVSQTLNSNNNLFDTATYTVTPTSSGCTGATFTLTVPIKPVPSVNNIFDTVCTGSGFNIIPGPVPLNTTYTWTLPTSIPFGQVIGGTANNTPVNMISQVPINTGTTPAQLLYAITPTANGCKGNTFSLLETVGVPLSPIPNTTATICSGATFDVTPVTVPANTKYTWTVQSITPPGTISGTRPQSSPQANITGTLTNLSALTATAVYAVSPTNTGCTGASFLATINVRAVPKASISGNPTICAYAKDTLSVSFLGIGPWSFDYLDNGVAKTQTGVSTNPYTWIVPTPLLSTGKTLAIIKVTDNACVDSIDTSRYVQKVNPLPIGNIVSLHGNYLCNNTIDTLWVSYTAVDSLKFQWTFNGTQIPGLNSDSLATLTPGRYNALFTNQYGCTDSSAAPINLIYIQQPVLNFSYDSYCINKQISFKNLTDTSFIGATNWLWNMGDSTTRNSFNASVVYPYSGDRHIRLTATQLYCQSYQTILDTTINIEFPIAGLRMPSVSAYLGQNTPIAVRNIPGYRYQWTPSRGIDHPDSSSVNFNYQITQEYLINLISQGGCITNDSVLVRVFDDKLVNIFVPKSFTPNGDGVNDILYPYLSGIKTFQYFKVYNRFGKLMFESRDPDAGWNGRLNGIEQPFAIYIWVSAGIANDGSLVEKRGETLLLR